MMQQNCTVDTDVLETDSFLETSVYNSPSKKFPCPNCSSAFQQKGSLTRHQRYECNQPPRFKCPFCLKCFKKTSHAYEHVRKKHSAHSVYIVDIKGDSKKGHILRP